MSHESSTPNSDATPTGSPAPAVRPFETEELEGFLQEDGQAGKVIASLLGFFFLYTIVVTPIAAWWTWVAVN